VGYAQFVHQAEFHPGANAARRVSRYAKWRLVMMAALPLAVMAARAADGVFYPGAGGPGHGKRIVFLAGDEEYRSEEGLPMLAKILAARHGFKCTVLFSINPADGTIDPNVQTNLPGIEALDAADLCVMQLRFRELPDDQMRHFVDYFHAGKPIIALRTSTHAFYYQRHPQSPYARFGYLDTNWPGGFGRQVLGQTWVAHHGAHGKESTRGVINPALADHPILRGVSEIWGPSDVYAVSQLPGDAQVLVWGQVLAAMDPGSPPVKGPKNDPMMPVVWVRQYASQNGKRSRIVTTTLGAAVDLENEGLRRLLVNACYWALGLVNDIPPKADVDFMDPYHPSPFGFGTFKKGVKPADLQSLPSK
jgi:hypothetical protein